MNLKKDSVILALIILNVIGFTFLFTYIHSLKSNNNEKEPIIIDEIKSEVICSINNSQEGMTEIQEVILYHTNNLLDSYTTKYNISLIDENAKAIFDTRKMNITEDISHYSNEPSIKIEEKINDTTNYNVSFSKDLSIPYSQANLSSLFNYKSDINISVNQLVQEGYTCN